MSGWIVYAAGRTDEMSHKKMSLYVAIQQDGDIIVEIHEDGIPVEDATGNKSRVEFCSLAGGGGRSPNTLRALRELYKALLQDGKEYPDGLPRYPVGLVDHMRKNE